jgi:hypothetical protein
MPLILLILQTIVDCIPVTFLVFLIAGISDLIESKMKSLLTMALLQLCALFILTELCRKHSSSCSSVVLFILCSSGRDGLIRLWDFNHSLNKSVSSCSTGCRHFCNISAIDDGTYTFFSRIC